MMIIFIEYHNCLFVKYMRWGRTSRTRKGTGKERVEGREREREKGKGRGGREWNIFIL